MAKAIWIITQESCLGAGLDTVAIAKLRKQIRDESGDPDAGIVVLPPGCNCNAVGVISDEDEWPKPEED